MFDKGKTKVPPFLLIFRLLGKNLHNCLVDLGASANVIPVGVSRKLGLSPFKFDKLVVQLEKLEVKVMGKLLNVHI